MAQAPADVKFVPLSVPEIRGNEWDYVKSCLDTGWVSSAGKYVTEFEQMFVSRLGASDAVACVNGTSALHVALRVAGVEPGSEVLTSNVTFIASANSITYAGAHPVVFDANLDTWEIDTDLLAQWVSSNVEKRANGAFNKLTGRPVSAIMPVHILGNSCDMDAVMQIARDLGIPVVEDATESLGGTYKGKPLGTIGDLGCFSFNGNKLITTGGGGMIVTNNTAFANHARYLTTQAKDDEEEFIHGEIGYNYRLTNVASAIGVAQMEQLDQFLATKRHIADRYEAALSAKKGLQLMPEPAWNRSALWLYTIRLLGRSSRPLMEHLKSQRIQSRPLWQPMHLSPAHPSLHGTACPNSEILSRECLSIPCSVGLTDEDQDRVIGSILEFLASEPIY